jgi:hypothetical protein
MLLLMEIGPSDRREEKDIDREFAGAASEIFGALLDGLVAGLLNLGDVKIIGKPRMADFALWAEACTRAYWPAGTFMRAYEQNIASANEVVIEANAVGDAVRHFMAGREEWRGTATDLLKPLTSLIPEALARERAWPKSARALSGKLRRAAPPLRKVGIDVAFGREGHEWGRVIVITARGKKRENFASAPSAQSAERGNPRHDSDLGADANADGMPTDPNANADHADRIPTQNLNRPSGNNYRRSNGFSPNADDADDADAGPAAPPTLAPQGDRPGRGTTGVPSEYAVLEELAAQGRPTNGFRPPRCDQCGGISGRMNPWDWPNRPDGIILHCPLVRHQGATAEPMT